MIAFSNACKEEGAAQDPGHGRYGYTAKKPCMLLPMPIGIVSIELVKEETEKEEKTDGAEWK